MPIAPTALLPRPLISPLFFFFSCHRHHRDLHSFPTRRSSDLHPRRRDRQLGETDADGVVHGVGDGGGDRKSTRLNSSHGSISYAVFCLKKKKLVPDTLAIHRAVIYRLITLSDADDHTVAHVVA